MIFTPWHVARGLLGGLAFESKPDMRSYRRYSALSVRGKSMCVLVLAGQSIRLEIDSAFIYSKNNPHTPTRLHMFNFNNGNHLEVM